MVDRLSPLDVSFLYLESPTTPMHVGAVGVFEAPADGFDYERYVRLIRDRLALVPRARQKVRWVPGHVAAPVWVDDSDFDITYHVRRAALPKPGTDDQLREFVARIQSRPLDRARPLWEAYLIEGLQGGRVAIVTKTHEAMVDGIAALDIASVMLDPTPVPRDAARDEWLPRREPSDAALVASAVTGMVRRPAEIVGAARSGLQDARRLGGKVLGVAGGMASALRTGARPAPDSPLNVDIGSARRFGMAKTDLDDYKRIRKAHGGTINDVVLATVSGALRAWLLTRGESVNGANIRAMVPVSVRGEDDGDSAAASRVSSYFVDLPVGEPNPVMRLHQVSYAMSGHKESGQSVGADAIIAVSGFAPPTLHALAARAANGLTRRLFNLVVSNVPGPQVPLYAAGATMLEMYPVVPLGKGQAVSIGLTSYNGGVFYGLMADRDAMADVDVLAQCIEESLAELLETVR